jgi:succinoglycan biosynthesis transport protein ExoP
VAVPTALGLLGALAVAFLLPPRYRASALVRAVWSTEADAALRRMTGDVARRRLQAVRERVLGRAMMERVLQEVGPYRPAGGEAPPLARQLEEMSAAVSVEPRADDGFLVQYVHDDPATAALVSNRLASLLVEESERERAAGAHADPALLEARLADAGKALEERREAIRRRQEKVLKDASGEPDPVRERLARLDAEKRTLAADLTTSRARADSLRRAIENENRPLTTVEGDPRTELEQLRSRLAELRKRYTEAHPDVAALKARIRRLEAAQPPRRDARVSSWRAQLAEVDTQIESLKQREASLEAESAQLAKGLGSPTEDLQTLGREFDEARKGYLALQEEWRAAETASRIGEGAPPRFTVLQPAAVPSAPCFPNRVLFALVGLSLGLALGLAAAMVAESRDVSVKSAADLRKILTPPLLAEIPFVRVRRRRRS